MGNPWEANYGLITHWKTVSPLIKIKLKYDIGTRFKKSNINRLLSLGSLRNDDGYSNDDAKKQ